MYFIESAQTKLEMQTFNEKSLSSERWTTANTADHKERNAYYSTTVLSHHAPESQNFDFI